MKINISHNFHQVRDAILKAQKQVPFALSLALNKTAEAGIKDVQQAMRQQFDRPTPYFMRSLRLIRASKAQPSPTATVWFKDKTVQSINGEDSIARPHVFGEDRAIKPMERRLQRAGLLPLGWRVVPGGGATLDAYGNISRGQISQVLNVLGTYKEAGYNKANAATRARLAKGNAKKGVYGFTYFVNPVAGQTSRGKHLPPGVYKRVATPFGSSLKPVIVFVQSTRYRKRLDMFGIVDRAVKREFGRQFDAAFGQAMRTARLSSQGSLFA
jgi:hypothetical protein